jgi:hypothetical protein
MAPDAQNDQWDKYAHPTEDYKAIFEFKDSAGDLELVVNHERAVSVKVGGKVSEDVIRKTNAHNKDHQEAVASFFVRAFTLLNHFLLRYRFNTFNHRTHPVKWQVRLAGENPQLESKFVVEIPIKWKLSWEIESDDEIDLLAAMNFKMDLEQGESWAAYGYSVAILDKTYDEVSKIVGGDPSDESKVAISADEPAYEIAMDLLMQAQEMILNEEKQRKAERSATVCSALITTAAACEVFVKGFVKAYGTSLHRFLVKQRSVSIDNLLHKVLADIPSIGRSLKTFNPELMHNIFLLSQARNAAVHRGKPEITIVQNVEEIEDIDDYTERLTSKKKNIICPITGWMIHSEMTKPLWYCDFEGNFGSFVWDVLALICWLRVMVGGQWLKPAVKDYWDRQSNLPVGVRETEILERTLALKKAGRL